MIVPILGTNRIHFMGSGAHKMDSSSLTDLPYTEFVCCSE